MVTHRFRCVRQPLGLALGLALAVWALPARADEPDKKGSTETPAVKQTAPAKSEENKTAPPAGTKPAEAGKPVKAGEKTFAFEMRDKPWTSVLEWLRDQTGVAVISISKPTGTFTF